MRPFQTLRWPDLQGWKALTMAAVVWLGAMWGQKPANPWLGGLVVIAGVAAVNWRRPLLVGGLVLSVVAGGLYVGRVESTLSTSVGTGPVRVVGVLATDAIDGVALFKIEASSIDAPRVVVLLRTHYEADAGDRLVVAGTMADSSGYWRGRPYAGVLQGPGVDEDFGPSTRWFLAAGAVRDRISTVYDGIDHRGGALVRGFLIGDTSHMQPSSISDLREAGLSHYVAVSGSNVALFLALVWIVMGPLAFSVRLRAAFGIVALIVFTLITRWEASVLRAAAMAGLLLVGRAAGYPLTAWSTLGSAATGLLLISPELAFSAGFQLSVAATAGVMAGAGLFPSVRFGPIRRSLAAAVGAQVAVAPVLLGWFGSVPLMSPLANIIAAPFVAVSTAVGGIAGLVGANALGRLAAELGAIVLDIAKVEAQGPQLGPLAAVSIALGFFLPRRSHQVAFVACVIAGITLGSTGSGLAANTVAFLDVGQGDSAVLKTEDGSILLIDGGPDPQRLMEHLDDLRIRKVDLMVLSHPHEDHVAGLVAAAEALPVGRLWHPGFVDGGETFDDLMEIAAARSVPVEIPAPGDSFHMGGVDIEVLAPRRRYVSPNDQSLVLRISTSSMSVLFAGDIETVAQRELGPVDSDVLKVPHQGAATSDLGWLKASAPQLSVVSVGPNSFGHPSLDVIDTLQAAGSAVVRTDEYGTIIVRLDMAIADQLIGAGSGKS